MAPRRVLLVGASDVASYPRRAAIDRDIALHGAEGADAADLTAWLEQVETRLVCST